MSGEICLMLWSYTEIFTDCAVTKHSALQKKSPQMLYKISSHCVLLSSYILLENKVNQLYWKYMQIFLKAFLLNNSTQLA